MEDLWKQPAVWGLFGAFVYAGPRFSACFYNAIQTKSSWALCAIDAVIALFIGSIAAAALAPWAQAFLGRNGVHELRALSTVIGLLANPYAPRVTKALGENLISRLMPPPKDKS